MPTPEREQPSPSQSSHTLFNEKKESDSFFREIFANKLPGQMDQILTPYQLCVALQNRIKRQQPVKTLEKFFNPLANRMDLNLQDMHGKTIFHYVMECLNDTDQHYASSIATSFLNAGANFFIKDNSGKAPFDLCKYDLKECFRNRVVPVVRQHLLDKMAEDPRQVIVAQFNDEKLALPTYINDRTTYLSGYPHISECHCCEGLSRSKQHVDLRGNFETIALEFFNKVPGDDEVTFLGSGSLLGVISLIAKARKYNPLGTLHLNLIDHQYSPGSGLDKTALFNEFINCMQSSQVSVAIDINQAKINIKDNKVEGPGFKVELNIYDNMSEYIRMKKTSPKIFAAIDLDMYRSEQHEMVVKAAGDAKAATFISVDKTRLMAGLVPSLEKASAPRP